MSEPRTPLPFPPLSGFDAILDARTPSEFAEDRIPGAVNVPALTNEERAEVGRMHQQDAFSARRRGAGLLAVNIARHLEERLADFPKSWRPLVYCWRGGQRSGAMAEVMRRVGWRAERLEGGYKRYRGWVMEELSSRPGMFSFAMIAGRTGTGKTRLLHALREAGAQVLDLEGLANHRGSVFGGMGAQPSQRMFESRLLEALCGLDPGRAVFAEAESRKIGDIHIPCGMLRAMRSAPAVLLEAELGDRAGWIAAEYEMFSRDAGEFERALTRLEKYAGAGKLRVWRDLWGRGDFSGLAADMLESFYDVGYGKSLAANYPLAAQAPPVRLNPRDAESVKSAAAEFMGRFGGRQTGGNYPPADGKPL